MIKPVLLYPKTDNWQRISKIDLFFPHGRTKEIMQVLENFNLYKIHAKHAELMFLPLLRHPTWYQNSWMQKIATATLTLPCSIQLEYQHTDHRDTKKVKCAKNSNSCKCPINLPGCCSFALVQEVKIEASIMLLSRA